MTAERISEGVDGTSSRLHTIHDRRRDRGAVEAAAADDDEFAAPRRRIGPGAVEIALEAVADALDDLPPVAAGTVEEALDAEDVVVLYDGDQPRFQRRRVGDRAEGEGEALEIVMVVILAFGLVMRRPRGEVEIGRA